MTKNEAERILQAFGPLHRFLRRTEKGEDWHAERSHYWAHAEQTIAALVVKEPAVEEPAKSLPKPPPPPPPPNEPSTQNLKELEQQIAEAVAEESEEPPAEPDASA